MNTRMKDSIEKRRMVLVNENQFKSLKVKLKTTHL